MLAPCMTVLSTSKNAAAVRSLGVLSAFSTSAEAAAASPASAERCCRLRRRGALGRGHPVSVAAPIAGAGLWKYLPMPRNDISAFVAEAAADVPDRQALVESGGRSLTWSALEDEVGRIATGLGARGIRAGQRVMIVVGNRIEFVTTYLGVLRAQVVAVPVNPRSTAGEVARMIVDSGTRLLVADETTLDDGRGPRSPSWASPRLPPVVVTGAEPGAGEVAFADLRADVVRPVPPLPDPEKLAALLYTSGTSGRPRAAMLSHRALLANIEQVAAVEPPMMHGDDVVLGVLPLFHVYGLNAVLGGVLRHRARLLLVEQLRPAGGARPHRRRGVQRRADRAAGLRPLAARRAPPGAARPGAAGAVRLRAAGGRGDRASSPRSPASRCTRATASPRPSPVVTSTLCSREPPPGSVGAALPGIELRLVDETWGQLEGEDPGQIQVRGDNLFSGYWPDGADGPDADGWYGTGDVGFLDASGDLFLVDRVKELVIVSGFNVYPTEVEDVLREVEGVADAAVIGVPDDRDRRGRRGLRRRVGEPARRHLEDAVVAHAVVRLARFKQPTPDRGRRRAAAHRHRQGAEGPPARPRAPARPRVCSSEPT